MPILGDLYDLLRKQSEPEAQNIATALEIYVNGSLNVFNHRSNIQMDHHRVLCFQLKSLGKALKEIGLLIMQDAVWNRVTANRSKHKTNWFYIDEFHLLLKGQTGSCLLYTSSVALGRFGNPEPVQRRNPWIV